MQFTPQERNPGGMLTKRVHDCIASDAIGTTRA
jgi:hypothetical protein